MIDKRILVFSMLTLAATASAVVGPSWRVRSQSGAGRVSVGSVEETAWALLAEADELCRSSKDRVAAKSHSAGASNGSRLMPSAKLDLGAAIARRAIALEALDIARELAQSRLGAEASALILRTQSRLRASCSAGTVANGSGIDSRRSLDGNGGSQRVSLLTPFFGRLNDAVGKTETSLHVVGRSAAVEPANELPKPARGRSAAVSEARAAVSEVRAAVNGALPEPPPGERPSEPSGIKIASASSDYQERVRSWAVVFEREASALRKSRSDLQREIDRHSMVESRKACRSFGMALARLDTDLVETAPSRGLSLRIEKMVERYWRGVAHCTSRRPAAAFSYLSEGDREWGTIARMASRVLEPRPMKRLPATGEVGAVGARAHGSD